MVIVQRAPRDREVKLKVEEIGTADLKPYQSNNRRGPYITAYFKVNSSTPTTFVIGDGRRYKFGEKYYINQPLEQNSKYIAFLRYFDDEVLLLSVYTG